MIKRIILSSLTAVLVATGCKPSNATITPVSVNALFTQAVETAHVMLTESAVPTTFTPLPVPTDTPLPSPTVTPKYSAVKYEYIYFINATQLVLVFTLNGARGNFHVTGNHYDYECTPAADTPDQLYCYGAFQEPGREVIFMLYGTSRSDPLLTLDILIPDMPPPDD
jgi:hypothetical protein